MVDHPDPQRDRMVGTLVDRPVWRPLAKRKRRVEDRPRTLLSGVRGAEGRELRHRYSDLETRSSDVSAGIAVAPDGSVRQEALRRARPRILLDMDNLLKSPAVVGARPRPFGTGPKRGIYAVRPWIPRAGQAPPKGTADLVPDRDPVTLRRPGIEGHKDGRSDKLLARVEVFLEQILPCPPHPVRGLPHGGPREDPQAAAAPLLASSEAGVLANGVPVSGG